MGFILTLPSSSSANYFPNNTLHNYTTQLPQLISLESEYEVALMEIQYTNNLFNIPRDETIFLSFKPDPEDEEFTRLSAILKAGYYSSITELTAAIKKTIRDALGVHNALFDLSVDTVSRKVTMNIRENAKELEVIFPQLLNKMLGYPDGSIKGEKVGDAAYDIMKGLHSMYIYSNILRPQIVGDSMVPLLRVVPIHGDRDQHVRESFQQLQYVPLNLRSFQSVEVDIRNEFGQDMPFHSGEVLLVLHFRRKIS